MHLFLAKSFSGTLIDCEEGKLEWVSKSKMGELNLWEGDLIFLRLLEQDVPFFSLKLVYQGEGLKEAVLNGERVK
jgi:8-oxo-dGTP diphosphatase